MFTETPPRSKDRLGFLESDRINTLDLPQDARLLPEIAKNIEAAMQTGKTTEVRVACAEFLSQASRFYQVPKCGVRVLAARPLKGREWVTELFGDYDPATMLIRLWMRTARKKERNHIVWDISEYAVPRVLSPPRLPLVQVQRFVAHERILRTHCRSLPSCTRDAVQTALLGSRRRRAF